MMEGILKWFAGVIVSAIVAYFVDVLILKGRTKIAAVWAAHKVKKCLKYFTVGKSRIGDGSVIKGE